MRSKYKILVCALDWGLGHTTRMIPLIAHLQNNGHYVHFAAGQKNISFLKKEFPNINTHTLPEVAPHYTRYKSLLFLYLILQSPLLFIKTLIEKRRLKRINQAEQFDLIINDNRFGAQLKNTPSIYVTHQTNIQFPKGYELLARLSNSIHHKIIGKHHHCFILDEQKEHSVAGALSNFKSSTPHTYIGISSRFKQVDPTDTPSYTLCILSGQEPQRSLLENKILNQAPAISSQLVLVRGTNKPLEYQNIPTNVVCHNLLNTSALNHLLIGSEVVICRSGYSSVMDLLHMQKKALLIPTPGQSEQEYLAEYLSEKSWFTTQNQKNLSLHSDLALALQCEPPKYKFGLRFNEIDKVINRLLEDG